MKKIITFCLLTLVLFTAKSSFATDYESDDQNENGSNIIQAKSPCGDGTCDDIEKTSGKCPQDCGGGIPNKQGKKLCGDGTCDDKEKSSGLCPNDCGNSNVTPGKNKNNLCGDGTCDEMETKSGMCPKDCKDSEDKD